MAQASADTTVTKETSTWTRVWLEGQPGHVSVLFVKGQVVRIATTFRNNSQVKVDPATTVLLVKKPDGTEITPTVDHDVDEVGEYHGVVPLDQAGLWRWRWTSTGDVAADEGQFPVAETYL